MPQCKCKMCGGTISFSETDKTATCEFCGTEQTVVYTDNAKKMNLFNRANSLRLNNDFDKALATYENILIDDPNEVEAHWGICLCRYGIEYVDDPKTKKKIPTCHRTVFNSIFDDIDYKETIENADVVAKRLYQEEAEKIDKIQKSILAISQKEEPYDIFICYKETDKEGNRTKDSVIAQEIYQELNSKGYKVFFARITLESKIGSQYEPIIFAALQSSKVMLVIGTKEEYFNAPWVKNEWSRFLGFMKEQRGKYLIPCYKEMEAYDMPEEFLALQSQNIDKLGFLQDLIRGIDKIFGREDKEEKVERNENVNTPKIKNLLKRVELCIEDENFEKANEIIEEILNEDAECAEAYYYLLIMDMYNTYNEEYGIQLDELESYDMPIEDNKNYEKALRFAGSELKEKINKLNDTINDNMMLYLALDIYEEGEKLFNSEKYLEAKEKFLSIEELIEISESLLQNEKLKDLSEKITQCENLYFDTHYQRGLKYKENSQYEQAKNEFKITLDYKDSKSLFNECDILIKEEKLNKIYEDNINKLNFLLKINSDKLTIDENNYKIALNSLREIEDYKDTKEKIVYYEKLLIEKKEEIAQQKAIEEEKKRQADIARKKAIEEEKMRQEALRLEREKQAKIKKDKAIRITKIVSPIVAAITTIILLVVFLFIPLGKYNKAIELMESKQYNEAIEILNEINFNDSNDQIKLAQAGDYFENKDYETAIKMVLDTENGKVDVNYDTDGGESKKSYESLKKPKYINNDCKKQGYDFYGWVLESYEMFYKEHYAKINLKASYDIVYYSLSFNLDGGSVVNDLPKKYTVLDEDILIENPTRTGYTFLGWIGSNLNEPTKDLVIKAGSIGNKNYQAKWEANVYEITYDWGYGDKVTTQEVTYNTFYTLTMPEREGYTFKYWNYNGTKLYAGDQNKVWNYDTDITLEAVWDLNTYDINYIMNGGTNHKDNPVSYTYESNTITLKSPEKIGYTFLGWTSEDCLEPTKDLTIPTHSFGNKTFTAHWQVNTYTITYNVNGGDSLDNDSQTVVYDSEFELIEPTRPGYKFAGWYYDGELVENGVWTFTKDVELEARWTIITYYIYYNLDDGVNNKDNPSSYTYESEDIVIKSPEKEGYTFLGWTSVDQNTPTINLVLSHNSTQDRTFTAHFEANTYVITYDVNGGDALEDNDQEVVFDDYFTLITPTRTGYSFVGWSYEGKLVDVNNVWSISEHCTLVAEWKANTYSITVQYINLSKTYDVTYDSMYSISLITNSSYNLVGIYTEEYGKGILLIDNGGNSIEKYTYSKNIIAYANYAYDVKFESNGGEEVETITIPHNEYLDSSIITTKDDRTFGGWYIDEELLNEVSYTKPLGNITLYAKWNEEVQPSNLSYSILSKEVSVNGLINYTDETVILPSHIGGKPVTILGKSAFSNNTIITSVFIPNTVKLIGDYAFYGCTSLVKFNSEKVGVFNIPEGVESIGSSVFCCCYNLKNIKLPATLSSIGSSAFSECSSLSDIEIPEGVESIGFAAFKGCNSLTTITLPSFFNFCSLFDSYYYEENYVPYSVSTVIVTGGESVGFECFRGCKYINYIKLPNTLKTIANNAFLGCSGLTSIDIPEGVTYIGRQAFHTCYNLSSIKLPSTLTKIDEGAFAYDSNLTSVYINDMAAWCNIEFNGHPSSENGTNLYLNNELVKNLIIPEEIKELKKSAFCNYSCIENVFLPKNLIKICDAVFSGCRNLISINIPENVESIGIKAFAYCSNLKSIVIPKGVSYIGEAAFANCINIEEITLPFIGEYANGTGRNRFEFIFVTVPESLKRVSITNCEQIWDRAFSGYPNIESITLPSNLKSIGSYAFSDCIGLVSIIIPESVEYIGESAFSGCRSLINISIPDKVTAILNNTFLSCGSIENISLSNNLKSIGLYAFSNCCSLANIIIPESVEYIGEGAFSGCESLINISIPNKVKDIGFSAFRNCSSLEGIILPFIGSNCDETSNNHFGYIFGANDYSSNSWFVPVNLKDVIILNCNKVEANTFYECENIVNIKLPNSIEEIGEKAFYECSSLRNFYISKNLYSIGADAFYNCNALECVNIEDLISWCSIKFENLFSNPLCYANNLYLNDTLIVSINLPEGIDTINSYAFSCFEKMISISFPSTLINISPYAFYGCKGIISLDIPNNVETIGDYAFAHCSGIINIKLSDKLININSNVFAGCNSLSDIILPKDLVSIGEGSFMGCCSLVNLEIPESVESIGAYAFKECISLVNLEIPESVESIGHDAFYNCSSITKINIPEGIENIENYTFYGCTNLIEVLLPETLLAIGDNVFYNCSSILNIEIPKKVKSIGFAAFRGCESLITISVPFVGQYSDGSGINRFGYIFGNEVYEGVIFGTIPNYIPTTLENIILTNCTSIKSLAFERCYTILSVTLPDNIKSIDKDAFIDCTNLSSIYIDNIESWCNIDFETCESNPLGIVEDLYINNELLEKLIIPESVSTIKSYAFYGYNKLSSVSIPNSITCIGKYSFMNCINLKSIYINDINSWCNIEFVSSDCNPLSYCENLFINNELLENLVIPENVSTIKSYAFYGYNRLKTVSIPNSVINMGISIFEQCNNIVSIALPFIGQSFDGTGYTHFGYIFGAPAYTDNCNYVPESLKQVCLTDGNKIFTASFYGCNNINNIILCNSITCIETYAFNGCDNINIFIDNDELNLTLKLNWNPLNRPVYWANEWSYIDGVPTPN